MTGSPEFFEGRTSAWFHEQFGEPTRVQAEGWRTIGGGAHALLAAPTGSGKTLAAFLVAIDRTLSEEDGEPGWRVVYVSPLKALVHDIERNLRAPLAGVARVGERLGQETRPLSVDVRTGDTPQRERQRMSRSPGQILVTTPESLFLLLGSKARANFRTTTTVIVDEIHALCGTKRGAHLAVSLERLARLADAEPQRIGLSATAHPLDRVAAFLGGDREVSVVDASAPPALEIEVRLPPPAPATSPLDEAARKPKGGSILSQLTKERATVGGSLASHEPERGLWADLVPEIFASIQRARSTIVFVNGRASAERLTQRLNERAGEVLARAHHGSVSHEERAAVEDLLKAGRVRAIVATSSLELGIDMGAVDQVLLVESPPSVASALQRVGRAGHSVGDTSFGRIYPKYPADLLEASVVAERMAAGAIEAVRELENPLDVLAQQLVAMVADSPTSVSELGRLVRRSAPFRELPEDALTATLDMLSGRYPSTDFADLSPRLAWDRSTDVLTARKGAAMLTRLSGGTIPDRGAFPVVVGEGGPRVGELDEEMVFESREGDVFLLGTSSWRIEEITRDRVHVSPAPGEPGRMPFWRGDRISRDPELGRAIGEFTRSLGAHADRDQAIAFALDRSPLDRRSAASLVDFVFEQREHTGSLPTDRSITIERFRDELGDWRICILTPFGARLHAPWALAIEETLGRKNGQEVAVIVTDDGLSLRLAETSEPPPLDDLFPDPEALEDLVVARVSRSSLFASLFRENAVRSLLIARRRADQRTPLWAQRLKAKNLLSVVERYPDFPIVLETYRQALSDVFDLGALTDLLRGVDESRIRVDEVETRRASPFARSLVFAFVSAFLYETDAPGMERRAQALTLDRSLLRELLGQADLRELLDADAIAEVEDELQRVAEERRARDADELHDLLRRVGDLDSLELCARTTEDPGAWLDRLEEERRAARVRLNGVERWIAAEDAGLFRDAFGCAPPAGLPATFLDTVEEPLEAFVRRYSRTHGPFLPTELTARYGLPASSFLPVLERLEREGVVLQGEFLPLGRRIEWCDVEVLRRIKRRTLAKLRGSLTAVDPASFARALATWHGVDAEQGSARALGDVLVQLEGRPILWSSYVTEVLPARLSNFQPRALDPLSASGEFVWIGRGAKGARDGRIAIVRRARAAELIDVPEGDAPDEGLAGALYRALEERGASFLFELERALDGEHASATNRDVEAALWELVWAGWITNDTFLPLRALLGPKRRRGAESAIGGRWSTVRSLVTPTPSPTERAVARCEMLLARYGLVARDMVRAEELTGGFAGLRRTLDAFEEVGRVRRGWFVDGLGGAQFAFRGHLEVLRRPASTEPQVLVLGVDDPAQPYGTLFPWPGSDERERPIRRTKGARVVLVDGHPVLLRSASKLTTFEAAPERRAAALRALADSRGPRGRRAKPLLMIDGVPALESALAPELERAGFVRDYQGFTSPL